jgi:hypothetical protein
MKGLDLHYRSVLLIVDFLGGIGLALGHFYLQAL